MVSDTVPVSGGVGCCRWSHEDRSYPEGTRIPLTAAAPGGQCCTNLLSVTTYHSSLEKVLPKCKRKLKLYSNVNIHTKVNVIFQYINGSVCYLILEKNFVFKKSIIHLNREKTVTSAINISRYSWILITNIPCMVKYI